MHLGLDGFVVVVTGASGGIGFATARVLADEGACVVLVAGTRAAELEETVARHAWARNALVQGADVTDAAAIERVFEAARQRFGRVDGAVACAGTWPPEDCRLDVLPPDRLRRVIDVNLMGSIHTARAWLLSLVATGPRADGRGAAAVLVGSTAGRFGERGHADYAIAKAGLRGLLLSLKNECVEVDPYARVNLVEPGWTRTPMAEDALRIPGAIERTVRTMALAQIGRAVDVARVIAMLLSPIASRHVSGEAVLVAGGMEGRVVREHDAVDARAIWRRLDDGSV